MSKSNIAACITEITELIVAKYIHSISLILAVLPASFIFYYINSLGLFDEEWEFLLLTVVFTTALCIMIYASVRVAAWLFYVVVVPGVMWLLYIAVHGLAWLLRTVIVPGTIWLLCVGLPILTRLLYVAACSLAWHLQNWGRSLKYRMAQHS